MLFVTVPQRNPAVVLYFSFCRYFFELQDVTVLDEFAPSGAAYCLVSQRYLGRAQLLSYVSRM